MYTVHAKPGLFKDIVNDEETKCVMHCDVTSVLDPYPRKSDRFEN